MSKTIAEFENETRCARKERDEAVDDGRSRGRTVWRKISVRVDDLIAEYVTANSQHSSFNDGAIQSLVRLKASLTDDACRCHVDESAI